MIPRQRTLRGGAGQALVFLLTQVLVVTSVPTEAASAQKVKQTVVEKTPEKPATQPPPAKVKLNKTRPKVDPVPQTPVFSNPPKDEEFFRARVFAEPFVPLGQTTVEENRAFAQALLAYHGGQDNENVGPLGLFLEQHPKTAWRASLLTNMGLHYHRTGYFTAAIQALTEAWNLGKESKERYPSALADRALRELLDLHTKFGQVEELAKLNGQVKGRDLHGGVVERVSNARMAIYVLREKHHEAIASAAVAVNQYLSQGKPGYKQHPEIAKFQAKPEGASLAEMLDLTHKTGLRMEMVQRPSGRTDVVVPSIVHFKQGHFAALVREEKGRYLLSDPILGSNDVWLSRTALLQEASGYFLVPEGKTPEGWSQPRASDAQKVRGKCMAWAFGGELGGPTCEDCRSRGMATYNLDAFFASLRITDTPVGYSPPRGASVDFTVRYHQREASQPQVFTFSNLGPRWSFSWLSYVEDDPNNLSAPVYTYVRGGWRETSSGPTSGTYPPHLHSRAVVVRTSSSPITYERRLPDGSTEVFSQSDGGVSPRRVFLTQLVDPQGNSLTLTYDGSLRVVSVTDSLSQVTTITYGLQSDPLKVTKVTDPFGRAATLEYDASGALIRITDVIGIVSEMEYGLTDFVRALTTPYGTTSFAHATPQSESGVYYADPWLEATDPLAGKERVQFRWSTSSLPASDASNTVPTGFSNNANLNIWNSYYWDKRAMALHPGDYTKARAWRWLAMKLGLVTAAVHSEKRPLEGRVWYEQVGESFVDQAGPHGRPAKIGRVLDDGSSQIHRYEYNSKGLKTRETDPLGRETVYEYDPNDIDLLRIKQKNASSPGGWDLLGSRAYRQTDPECSTQPAHLACKITDAAGQTTTATYNAYGQIATITTPPRAGITENRTTTFTYDANGYLQNVAGPASGATASFTYDGYGRVRTQTDQVGYTLTYDYDALDRLTKVTYPDGTYEQSVYNRLDPEQRRDRVGRWTHTFHDALRRPVATRDPLGRTTTQQWCTCGSLDKLIDANSNPTIWERDLQGRITKETRADSSFTQYVYENTTSRRKQRIDRRNQAASYEYFLDNRLKQVTYTNAQYPTAAVNYTYDPAYPRPVTMTDGTGTTTYAFNPISQTPALGAGRLATIDGPLANDTMAFTYDELGRVVGRSINGVSVMVSFDALGRVSSETDPLGTFSYAYVGATSRFASTTFPNGQTTIYAYFDNLGDNRLQEIKHLDPAAAVLSKFNYTYDAVGQAKTWTQQAGTSVAKVYTLGYDDAEQLISTVVSGVSPTPVPSRFGYRYDNAGNRTAEQLDDSVTGATYNNLDQLISTQAGGALLFRGTVNEPATVTVGGKPAQVNASNAFEGTATVPSGTSTVAVAATDPSGNVRTNTYQVSQTGGSKTPTYDLGGNLTGDGTRSFSWDAENRLVAVDQGTHRSEFTYDGLGRRVRMVEKDNGVVTSDKHFVWCGIRACQERDAGGATVTKAFYRHGILDGGLKYFTTVDHLGSTREMTDNSGVARARYEYDPYGRMTKVSGSYDATFGFTGHYFHVPTGLALPLYRAYAADLGRWTSEDPAGLIDGPNRYRYVQDNPVNSTDPTGEFTGNQSACIGSWTVVGTIIGGTLGGAGGTVVTVASMGIAIPTIPGGIAGGAAGGAAAGAAIAMIVCQPALPTFCSRIIPFPPPGGPPKRKCYFVRMTTADEFPYFEVGCLYDCKPGLTFYKGDDGCPPIKEL